MKIHLQKNVILNYLGLGGLMTIGTWLYILSIPHPSNVLGTLEREITIMIAIYEAVIVYVLIVIVSSFTGVIVNYKKERSELVRTFSIILMTALLFIAVLIYTDTIGF